MTDATSSQPRELPLAELVRYLDEYLEIQAVRDFCPNGLQVEGRSRGRRLVTGVSACGAVGAGAGAADADAILVHHGLFWEGTPRALTGMQYRRVAALVRREISLLAYHLPLDRHPELGNNALASRALGLVEARPFGVYEGVTIGFGGDFPQPIPATELVAGAGGAVGAGPRGA